MQIYPAPSTVHEEAILRTLWRLSLAASQGETSVATESSAPVWNEQISFIEQFPPLAQRIRVQVLDDAKMRDIVLATHFLDLQQISDPTRNGTVHIAHLFSRDLTGILAKSCV